MFEICLGNTISLLKNVLHYSIGITCGTGYEVEVVAVGFFHAERLAGGRVSHVLGGGDWGSRHKQGVVVLAEAF